MNPIFDVIAWPIVGLMQATVGILWPSSALDIRRLQRATLALALIGVLSLVVGFLVAHIGVRLRYSIWIFVLAYVSLVIAGMFGRRIEDRCKSEEMRDQ